MKKGIHALLLAGTVCPLILLFWPFASWGDFAGVLLRVIPAASLQALLCRTVKSPAVQAVPLVLTGVLALWGSYLYVTSTHWIHATIWDLLRDYAAPFIACTGTVLLRRKKV